MTERWRSAGFSSVERSDRRQRRTRRRRHGAGSARRDEDREGQGQPLHDHRVEPGGPRPFSGGNTAVFITDAGVIARRHQARRLGPGDPRQDQDVTNKPVTTHHQHAHARRPHRQQRRSSARRSRSSRRRTPRRTWRRWTRSRATTRSSCRRETYKDKLTLGSGKDRDRPVLLRRGPHQRRHLGRVPGAARDAHRRHVRVEGRAALDAHNGGSGVEYRRRRSARRSRRSRTSTR